MQWTNFVRCLDAKSVTTGPMARFWTCFQLPVRWSMLMIGRSTRSWEVEATDVKSARCNEQGSQRLSNRIHLHKSHKDSLTLTSSSSWANSIYCQSAFFPTRIFEILFATLAHHQGCWQGWCPKVASTCSLRSPPNQREDWPRPQSGALVPSRKWLPLLTFVPPRKTYRDQPGCVCEHCTMRPGMKWVLQIALEMTLSGNVTAFSAKANCFVGWKEQMPLGGKCPR